MITKTERIDIRLKGCTISEDGELSDQNGEIINLLKGLREIYGEEAFDLTANSVKKSELKAKGIVYV